MSRCELARFGGPEGTTAAEQAFAADSAVVVDLVAALLCGSVTLEPLVVAVLTTDAWLSGCGLSEQQIVEWCRRCERSREESGADYRRWKGTLRPLMLDGAGAHDVLPPAIERLHRAGSALRHDLEALAADGTLTCSPAEIYRSIVHLHLNRLFAADNATEARVFGLLDRVRAGLLASGTPRRSHPTPR